MRAGIFLTIYGLIISDYKFRQLLEFRDKTRKTTSHGCFLAYLLNFSVAHAVTAVVECPYHNLQLVDKH
jgi:hypothetical protein